MTRSFSSLRNKKKDFSEEASEENDETQREFTEALSENRLKYALFLIEYNPQREDFIDQIISYEPRSHLYEELDEVFLNIKSNDDFKKLIPHIKLAFRSGHHARIDEEEANDQFFDNAFEQFKQFSCPEGFFWLYQMGYRKPLNKEELLKLFFVIKQRTDPYTADICKLILRIYLNEQQDDQAPHVILSELFEQVPNDTQEEKDLLTRVFYSMAKDHIPYNLLENYKSLVLQSSLKALKEIFRYEVLINEENNLTLLKTMITYHISSILPNIALDKVEKLMEDFDQEQILDIVKGVIDIKKSYKQLVYIIHELISTEYNNAATLNEQIEIIINPEFRKLFKDEDEVKLLLDHLRQILMGLHIHFDDLANFWAYHISKSLPENTHFNWQDIDRTALFAFFKTSSREVFSNIESMFKDQDIDLKIEELESLFYQCFEQYDQYQKTINTEKFIQSEYNNTFHPHIKVLQRISKYDDMFSRMQKQIQKLHHDYEWINEVLGLEGDEIFLEGDEILYDIYDSIKKKKITFKKITTTCNNIMWKYEPLDFKKDMNYVLDFFTSLKSFLNDYRDDCPFMRMSLEEKKSHLELIKKRYDIMNNYYKRSEEHYNSMVEQDSNPDYENDDKLLLGFLKSEHNIDETLEKIANDIDETLEKIPNDIKHIALTANDIDSCIAIIEEVLQIFENERKQLSGE